MKNLNNEITISNTDHSTDSLEFNEVTVYHEMADQTSVKLNLIEQIQSQLNQLNEMNLRKQYLLKEIFSETLSK
jgi:hypothetical protein